MGLGAADAKTPAEASGRVATFGPFRLIVAHRLLLDEGGPVRLGDRAIDVLTTLLDHPGEIVPKRVLFDRVWPDQFVQDANLKVQIASLRRALRDGQDGANYIANVMGRGYRFVAPIKWRDGSDDLRVAEPSGAASLPEIIDGLIGREAELSDLAGLLARRRLVTVVGPGGIGKTTVAMAIVKELAKEADRRLHVVELAQLSDTMAVPGAVAAALGLPVSASKAIHPIVSYLNQAPTTVVLDNCEHLISPIAALVETLLREAPGCRVLATSREPLRLTGEAVFALAPLRLPPAGTRLTAIEAQAFAAVRLLVERAALDLTDSEARLASDLCRRLDGIPLAIELAAALVQFIGLRGVAEQLRNRFSLLNQGRRGSLPRHRTLRATLDWSYDLLSKVEQQALRRLAIFSGPFLFECAEVIAADPEGGRIEPLELVSDLITKSLVSVDASHDPIRLRLLTTTREYALEKLRTSGEYDQIAERHARYLLECLDGGPKRAGVGQDFTPGAGWQLDDVRQALEWVFGQANQKDLAVALAAAASKVFLTLVLFEECRSCTARALALVHAGAPAAPEQVLQLYVVLSAAVTNLDALSAEQEGALVRAEAVARDTGDIDAQLRVGWCRWLARYMAGDFPNALAIANAMTAWTDVPQAGRLIVRRLQAVTHHMMGRHDIAWDNFQAVASGYQRPKDHKDLATFAFDQLVATQSFQARILWLRGLADQAVELGRAAMAEARALNHSASLYYSIVYAGGPLSVATGDRIWLSEIVATLADPAAPYIWRVQGALFSALGEVQAQTPGCTAMLSDAIGQINEFNVDCAGFKATLAESMSRGGCGKAALPLIEGAIAMSAARHEAWRMPDLLRIRAEVLFGEGARDAALTDIDQSMAMAEAQGALAWQLRTATTALALASEEGRTTARRTLESVMRKFHEGHETYDFRQARRQLELS